MDMSKPIDALSRDVERYRAQLNDGSSPIDPDKIADAVLASTGCEHYRRKTDSTTYGADWDVIRDRIRRDHAVMVEALSSRDRSPQGMGRRFLSAVRRRLASPFFSRPPR